MPNHSNEPDLELNAASIVNKILEDRKRKEQQTELLIERETEWAQAANRLFSSPDGKLFIKYLLKATGMFAIDNSRDAAKLLEDKGKRQLYIQLIRQYLTPELLMELENQK